MNLDVDYKQIPGVLADVRSYAEELNNELVNIFKSLNDMHNSWKGKKYAIVTKRFDECVPHLNKILELVVTNIPASLETIYNNYNGYDNEEDGKVGTKVDPIKINEINASADETLYFISEQVIAIKTNVSSSMERAEEYMNRIDSAVNSFHWQDESGEDYLSTLRDTKNQINKDFADIESLFSTQMQEASDDAARVISANKVNN